MGLGTFFRNLRMTEGVAAQPSPPTLESTILAQREKIADLEREVTELRAALASAQARPTEVPDRRKRR